MINLIAYTGNPIPNITWYKDGVTPPSRQNGMIIYTQWTMILEHLMIADSGNYTCKVSNENGFIDFTYEVEIKSEHRYHRGISNILLFSNY